MNSPSRDRQKIIVIAGATASGKSDIAMSLANQLPIEIVCADARTVYRGLSIGTAKPSVEDQASVPHHCIDILDPDQIYTASTFSEDARIALASLQEGATGVVVGGSGFYIKALIDGLSEGIVDVPEEIRLALANEFESRGKDEMYDELMNIDARAAELYADKNPRRVQRALEYYRATGDLFSSTWDKPRCASEFDVVFVAVQRERDELRQRIADRCSMMWSKGLLRETEQLLESGIPVNAQSLQTVGYKQALDVLFGRSDIAAAQQEMITATWQYAKRQLTWFRKDTRYTWISGSAEQCVNDILQKHHER
jgi:tRNA dimethylallyltransferase